MKAAKKVELLAPAGNAEAYLNASSDDSDKSPQRLPHLGQKRKDRDENN